ncbi:MAG: cadmium-translocating P-type ATPase [Bradyrhizobiaceae bacterium]|nr:cadmium-translocating P-type ATPase [Bradyrhizobiaceae bacterium]
MAEAVDFSAFVTARPDGACEMQLAVEGVHCAGCMAKIERTLGTMPGVTNARLNFTNRRLTVDWRKGEVEPGAIVEKLETIGYRAHPFAHAAEDEEARQAAFLLRCLAVAGFAAMNIMLLSVSVWSGNFTDITPETRDFFHWLSALIALPAAAYAGQPFFRSALNALRHRSLNMDVPISLGVLLALGLSVFETAISARHAYFDSAVMLLFFLLAGRYLDLLMRKKTRALAGNISALKAEVAHRLEGGRVTTVPVVALRPDDEIMVKPGERVPADGVLLAGTSEIDESLVTGETALKRVQPGDAVYSGSMNFDGALTLRVTAAGERSLLGEVERLLEVANARRSKYLRLADRAAQLYAPMVHLTAALTLFGWLAFGGGWHMSIVTAITVLIITCPCALALAVPAVQVVATGALFRSGVLLFSGDAVERLAEADTVVFDKTGTLTLPEPRLANARDIAPDLLETAARLALASRHPLAKAVARESQDKRPVAGAVEEPGSGVRATIDGAEARLGSPAFCGIDLSAAEQAEANSVIAFRHGARTAVFQVRQTLRSDAASVIVALQAKGLDVRILSGDRNEAVAEVAAALGVADWRGGIKPAEKIAVLEELKAGGRKVLMVGDGLNDAPALAAAAVSLSPITAADLTQAQADAVFLGERLQPVLDGVEVARRARRLMQQNLWLAVIYNAIAVPIAIAGLVTPLIAALAMSGSSILVTLNALRAGGRRPAPGEQAAQEVPAMLPIGACH